MKGSVVHRPFEAHATHRAQEAHVLHVLIVAARTEEGASDGKLEQGVCEGASVSALGDAQSVEHVGLVVERPFGAALAADGHERGGELAGLVGTKAIFEELREKEGRWSGLIERADEGAFGRALCGVHRVEKYVAAGRDQVRQVTAQHREDVLVGGGVLRQQQRRTDRCRKGVARATVAAERRGHDEGGATVARRAGLVARVAEGLGARSVEIEVHVEFR